MSEAQSAAAASSSPAEAPLRRADELDPVAEADTQRTVKVEAPEPNLSGGTATGLVGEGVDTGSAAAAVMGQD
eukprot:353436-Prorocentrum_lima.AAC.1